MVEVVGMVVAPLVAGTIELWFVVGCRGVVRVVEQEGQSIVGLLVVFAHLLLHSAAPTCVTLYRNENHG